MEQTPKTNALNPNNAHLLLKSNRDKKEERKNHTRDRERI